MGKKKSFVFYHDWRDILEPFDDERLARLMRAILKYAVDDEETIFDDLALTVSYNFIKNTLERDKVKYHKTCELKSMYGKMGGRPKKNISDTENHNIEDKAYAFQKNHQLFEKAKKADNDNVNDNVNDNDNDNVNDNVNVNDNETNISPFSAKTVCGYSDDFLAFWREYPKKVGKGEAFKKWKKERISPDELSDILKALKWQRSSDMWRKNGGQYIPNPSTYISQRRWEDEPMGLSADITDPSRYNDGDELPDYIMKGVF